MKCFEKYLSAITEPEQRARMEVLLKWVSDKFPDLEQKIAWNEPTFTHHGTFIIGFSISKHHIAIAPEPYGIKHFSADIQDSGYHLTPSIFRVKWSQQINFSLLEKIIAFNIADKADCSTFWRK